MANNFNLRSFLTENKLTKNAQLVKEDTGKEVNWNSIEIGGVDPNDYPDFADAFIEYAEYEDGTPLTDEELYQLDSDGSIAQERAFDTLTEQEDTVEEALQESRLTTNEKRLVEMVNKALKEEENVDYTMGHQDDPNQLSNPAPELNIPEGDESIEEVKPLPKYNSIEELMKEIEHGTNEAAHKYKMDEMKRVYEALEAKVGSLEEGEHAEHIDQKAVKQMRKDIAALRKAEEKLRKEFDKKFSGKEKKETPAKEKAVEALQEGTFDLRKFLAENRK